VIDRKYKKIKNKINNPSGAAVFLIMEGLFTYFPIVARGNSF
jgi:hypothetical protein